MRRKKERSKQGQTNKQGKAYMYIHVYKSNGNTRVSYRVGGPGISPPPPSPHEFPSRILKNYDVTALKDEKTAVVLHTSDGNLGVVS